MTRRTTRSHGVKKNTKLIKQVMLDSADVSLPVDQDDVVSEVFEHCESSDVPDLRILESAGNQNLNSQVLSASKVTLIENQNRISDSDLNGVPSISNHDNLGRQISSSPLQSELQGGKQVGAESVVPEIPKVPTEVRRKFFRSEKSLGALQYFEPTKVNGKVVVNPPKAAIEEGILKWSPSLVGQFFDKPLPFYVVKRFVDSLWACYGKVEVFLLENGLFLFRFADEKTRDEVWEAKLWHVANKPLILRRWAPGMQLLKLSVSSVPVWIKLHNLPMEFWNATCLSYVASGVEKPLCADTVTEEQLRLGFARILVEVNIDSDFPKEIQIVGVNGLPVVVGIEYPWIPLKCKKCKSFGHASHTCTRVESTVWLPKRPAQEKIPVQKASTSTAVPQQVVVTPVLSPEQPWTVVRSSKKSPAVESVAGGKKNTWSNSFQLLARADHTDYEEGEVRPASSDGMEVLPAPVLPRIVDKGKNVMVEEVEVLMRGFSPTS